MGIIVLLLKCTEITKSAITLISCFAAVVALHRMKVKRSTIYKVKYGVAKLSITVQVHIENDSAKYLIL